MLVFLKELEKRAENISGVTPFKRLTHRKVQVINDSLSYSVFLLLKPW